MNSPARSPWQWWHLKHHRCHCWSIASNAWPLLISSSHPAHPDWKTAHTVRIVKNVPRVAGTYLYMSLWVTSLEGIETCAKGSKSLKKLTEKSLSLSKTKRAILNGCWICYIVTLKGWRQERLMTWSIGQENDGRNGVGTWGLLLGSSSFKDSTQLSQRQSLPCCVTCSP